MLYLSVSDTEIVPWTELCSRTFSRESLVYFSSQLPLPVFCCLLLSLEPAGFCTAHSAVACFLFGDWRQAMLWRSTASPDAIRLCLHEAAGINFHMHSENLACSDLPFPSAHMDPKWPTRDERWSSRTHLITGRKYTTHLSASHSHFHLCKQHIKLYMSI